MSSKFCTVTLKLSRKLLKKNLLASNTFDESCLSVNLVKCLKDVTFFSSYISQAGLVSLKSGTRSFLLSTNLPQGKTSDDYNVTVKVKISNNAGIIHVDTLVVKVRWYSLTAPGLQWNIC